MIISQYCTRNEERAEDLRAGSLVPFGEKMGSPRKWVSRPCRPIDLEDPPTLFIWGWQDENSPHLPQRVPSLEGGSVPRGNSIPGQARGRGGLRTQRSD